MIERQYRLGPVVIGLRAEGLAVEAFVETLSAFATEHPADALVVIAGRVDSDGPRATALPTVHGQLVVGDDLRAELSERTLRVSRVLGSGGVANAFRWMLAQSLLSHQAVLLHCVGVASGGHAAVFTGRSGAGKSTLGMAAAAGGLSVLADELVVVQAGATPCAYGTPWNTGARAEGKLRLIGTLGWAAQPLLAPVPPSEVLRVACDNVLVPGEDPRTRSRVAEVLISVLRGLRTARLDFAPNPGVADVLRAELL